MAELGGFVKRVWFERLPGTRIVQCFTRHSSPQLSWGLSAGLILALGVWLGASWQDAKLRPRLAVQRTGLDARPSGAVSLLQVSLAQLAARVGELQGRVLAIEVLRSRLSEAAGLAYMAPELVRRDAGRTGGGDLGADTGAGGMAENLGRRIDDMASRLAHEEDAHTLMDAALSRQAGLHASLPTALPVRRSRASSSFGWRRNPVSGRHAMHEGLDFAASRGTPIRAASGGVVLRAGPFPGYGRMVEVDHGNGLRSRYAHASSVLVRQGDIVQQGDPIARVGSTGHTTGSHLHFEIRLADHALDPALFVRRGGAAEEAPVVTPARAAARAPRDTYTPVGG